MKKEPIETIFGKWTKLPLQKKLFWPTIAIFIISFIPLEVPFGLVKFVLPGSWVILFIANLYFPFKQVALPKFLGYLFISFSIFVFNIILIDSFLIGLHFFQKTKFYRRIDWKIVKYGGIIGLLINFIGVIILFLIGYFEGTAPQIFLQKSLDIIFYFHGQISIIFSTLFEYDWITEIVFYSILFFIYPFIGGIIGFLFTIIKMYWRQISK